MPALVNIRVGSFFTTIGADGTMRCSLFLKNSKKDLRNSSGVMFGLWKIGLKQYVKGLAKVKHSANFACLPIRKGALRTRP